MPRARAPVKRRGPGAPSVRTAAGPTSNQLVPVAAFRVNLRDLVVNGLSFRWTRSQVDRLLEDLIALMCWQVARWSHFHGMPQHFREFSLQSRDRHQARRLIKSDEQIDVGRCRVLASSNTAEDPHVTTAILINDSYDHLTICAEGTQSRGVSAATSDGPPSRAGQTALVAWERCYEATVDTGLLSLPQRSMAVTTVVPWALPCHCMVAPVAGTIATRSVASARAQAWGVVVGTW